MGYAMKHIILIISILSFNASAEGFPSADEQILVLCGSHKQPAQCRELARKMLATSYRIDRAAKACTADPYLPYCDDIFKDASDLDKWGK